MATRAARLLVCRQNTCAGPDHDFQHVAYLMAGTQMTMFGCLQDYYGVVVGLPVISFSIKTQTTSQAE